MKRVDWLGSYNWIMIGVVIWEGLKEKWEYLRGYNIINTNVTKVTF